MMDMRHSPRPRRRPRPRNTEVRRRALRAARVATLGLVVGAPGCYAMHDPTASPDAEVIVDSEVREDSGATDTARADSLVADTSPVDSSPSDSALGDAGDCTPLQEAGEWEAFNDCCAANGWDPDRGCLAWGPFVPPADGELA